MTTDFIFITANDIHISDDPPRARTDDFKATILDKISQMGQACSKLKADAVIIAGDLFNNKKPVRNSHRMNRDLVEVFNKFPCPIFMIEGNHDLTANRLDSVPDQPLGVLFADKTLIQLRHEVIEKDGHKVSIVGVPFDENLEPKTLILPPKGDAASQICVLHLYAGLKAGRLFKERLYGYDELSVLNPDIFVIGHYHIDQGIYEHQGKYFVNIGSMSRGTLSEEDIVHSPQIGIIKISVDDLGNPSYMVRAVKLRVKPASEIFDLVKKEEEKKENTAIEAFVDKLASEAAVAIINAKDENKSIDDFIESMDIARQVKNKVLGFIREAAQTC